MPPRLKLHHRPSLHLYPNSVSLSRREIQQEEGSMGSTSSRHASRPPTHPRPKKTLKRTLSSIFVCGSSSSTLPNETEDDPTEDYCNRGNPTKFQRPKKEFTHILTSPRTKNRAFLESNVVVNGNPSSESSSSNHNTPLPEPNPSKERVEVSFINENDDTVERVTQCNQSSHAFDDLLAVENEFLVDNSSSESVNAHQETIPLILGLNVIEREQEQGDVTSVSSENDTRELRVDGRRLIWDAFVMDNGGRLSDSQSFLLSSDDLDDSDDSGSGDVSLDGGVGGDSRNLGSQTHSFIERRQHTSSEIWESIRHGQTGRCPSGLHSYGSCSCEPTPITHDTRPRASLSRIFTLADTLFEVLDEIQRQPLSLPSNMNSLPAPNSVVDSLPLKSHKVKHKSENDIEQCQICLAEYEEGDEIRVLPCHHEYHMSCVDKWLKESHRVCPLCRGDVCEAEATVSNPEIPLA